MSINYMQLVSFIILRWNASVISIRSFHSRVFPPPRPLEKWYGLSFRSIYANVPSLLYAWQLCILRFAPAYTVRKNNEKGVQHVAIDYLRELVKKESRIDIIRKREKLWPRKDR